MCTNMDNSSGNSSTNPAGNGFRVELSMPKKFEIKMVNASSMNDYELWGIITSVLCNFVVGFIVAAVTYTKEYVDNKVLPSSEQVQNLLWAVSAIFFVLTLLPILMTLQKRRTIKKDTKKVQYEAKMIQESKE